jgi:hypothetical protein
MNTTLNIRRLFDDFSKSVKKNEGFSKGLENVAKGLETVGFESINLGYRASMDLSNSYMGIDYLDYGLAGSKANYMLYSFGVFDRSFMDFVTGNMNDGNAFGGVQNRIGWQGSENFNYYSGDMRKTSQSVNGSTSMKIPKPIEISINTISLGWTKSYQVTPETDKINMTLTFPDLSIGMSSSALEQIEVVKQNFSMFRLDWGYNYRHTKTISGAPSSKIENNYTVGWGLLPLIKTTVRLKKIGIDLSYSLSLGADSTSTYNSSKEKNIWIVTLVNSSKTKTITNSWAAGYHVDGRKGRTIKLFRDQIVEINGDIDYGLGVDVTKTKHYFTKNLSAEDENYEDITLNFGPVMKYKFTKNIDAILRYDLSHSITGKEELLSHVGKGSMEVTISF